MWPPRREGETGLEGWASMAMGLVQEALGATEPPRRGADGTRGAGTRSDWAGAAPMRGPFSSSFFDNLGNSLESAAGAVSQDLEDLLGGSAARAAARWRREEVERRPPPRDEPAQRRRRTSSVPHSQSRARSEGGQRHASPPPGNPRPRDPADASPTWSFPANTMPRSAAAFAETARAEVHRRFTQAHPDQSGRGSVPNSPGAASTDDSSAASTTSATAATNKAVSAELAGCKFAEWPILDLKQLLEENQVDFSNCVEKGDLVSLCRALTWPLPEVTEDENHQCSVCFEHRIDAVLIYCGHQFCSCCTYGLDKCPICKSSIAFRVRTYR
mmetsp:Transcript_24520/g.78275  ORF Transcript_24520/g.78275 Transcript_24520/m.78275 type:complete len:329 (-) Transcript_24520:420-1406(-)